MPLWESNYEEAGDDATKSEHSPPPPPPRRVLTPSYMRRDQYGVMIIQVKLLKRLTDPSQTDCIENPGRIRLPETEGRVETPKEVLDEGDKAEEKE